MALTRKHYKELAVMLGKLEARLMLKERHATAELWEEITDFLKADNKNFSYSIFLDAFHDATEDYLRQKEAEEVLRKEAEQKNNITTSITI